MILIVYPAPAKEGCLGGSVSIFILDSNRRVRSLQKVENGWIRLGIMRSLCQYLVTMYHHKCLEEEVCGWPGKECPLPCTCHNASRIQQQLSNTFYEGLPCKGCYDFMVILWHFLIVLEVLWLTQIAERALGTPMAWSFSVEVQFGPHAQLLSQHVGPLI